MSTMFRESFEAMVAALRADARVEVYAVTINPPASDSDLADAEALIGRPLPDDVRAFYQAHDGVFLSWGLRGRTYHCQPTPFGYPDRGTPPGVINLLPIAQAFSEEWVDSGTINWSNDVHRALYGVDEWGDDEESDDDRVRAVLVDHFGNFNHVDLVFGPVDRPAWTLVASDHGADLHGSNLSSFSTYLDTVIAIWGTARMPAYRTKSHHERVELTSPALRLTLDEAIAEAEKD